MKKFLLAFLIIIAFCSCSYGAVSDDIYVRKDLFEVYMQNINSNSEKIFAKLDRLEENMNDIKKSVANLTERVGKLEEKVEGNYITLSNGIGNLENRFSNSINGLEKRFDDLRYDIYLIIGLLGAFGVFLGLPFFQKWWTEHREAKRNSLTIEDVEKLFERLLLEAKSKGAI